jgi:hypothetical protein
MFHLDVVNERLFGGEAFLTSVADERRQRRVVRSLVVTSPHVCQPFELAGKFQGADLKRGLT